MIKREGSVGGHPTATLVGTWKCCLPWCGAPEAKAPPIHQPPSTSVDTIESAPQCQSQSSVVDTPQSVPRSPQQAPLTDILEEDLEGLLEEEEEEDGEKTPLKPLGSRLSVQKKKNVLQS
ncbi:hypothetical protein GWI33_014273 [Rhynchophorus ferrugineus]|uniref:Uncharacterized protein n=1 Tax=Rhynchophorus ferrugineus TaxID=354439 RepID=A0A834M992_RHYFE|nr:hypothetical protein GWI33_014273 [Rhynchophorus ferrugineus]